MIVKGADPVKVKLESIMADAYTQCITQKNMHFRLSPFGLYRKGATLSDLGYFIEPFDITRSSTCTILLFKIFLAESIILLLVLEQIGRVFTELP